MVYCPKGPAFDYGEGSCELLEIAKSEQKDPERAQLDPLIGEIEGGLLSMKLNLSEVALLTNPASFLRAYRLAKAGDDGWEEPFKLVGSKMLNALRSAMFELCKQGKVEALNRSILEESRRKEEERVKAHNAKARADMRGLIRL